MARILLSGLLVLFGACSGAGDEADPGTESRNGDIEALQDLVFMDNTGFVCAYFDVPDFMGGKLRFGGEEMVSGNGVPGAYCVSFGPGNRVSGDLVLELEDGRVSEPVTCITPAWIDEIAPQGAQAGETVTVKGGNFGLQYPAGHGSLLGPFRVERWTDTEIDLVVLVHTLQESEVRVTKTDGSQNYDLKNKINSSNSVALGVAPAIHSSCRVSPGVRCRILGGAFPLLGGAGNNLGSVTLDGKPVDQLVSGDTELSFVMPQLAPGAYVLEVTNSAGYAAEVEVHVPGWTRATVSQLSTTEVIGALDRAGTMHPGPDGGLAVVTQSISFLYSDTDNTFFEGGYSFGTRLYGGLVPDGGPAGRPFESIDAAYDTGPEELNVETASPRVAASPTHFYFAVRAGYTPSLTVLASENPFDGSAKQTPVQPNPTAGSGRVSGLAYAAGRTWLTVQNDDSYETDLYWHAGAIGFVREMSLPGLLVLYVAGDQLYLAAGEPECGGPMAQVWLEEEQAGEPEVLKQRTLPEFPGSFLVAWDVLYAGSDDGSLYVGFISDAGEFAIGKLASGSEAWEPIATVPDTVPGVPSPAVLQADHQALGIVDMGVLDGVVYLLSQTNDGEGRLRVFHLDGGNWVQTNEEIAAWHPAERFCTGPWGSAVDHCGSASGIGGCGIDECSTEVASWRPRSADVDGARMMARAGQLWVLYEVRYHDSLYQGMLGEDWIMAARLNPSEP